jgi:molybdate transport system ATP-binding protein/molybdate transport system permease protein
VAAGVLLAWLRAFGEFGATVILAYHPYSLPVFTFVQFDATGLPATMLPIAAALAAAIVLLVLTQLPWPLPRRRRTPLPAPSPRPPRPPAALEFALDHRLGTFALDVAHRAGSPRLALLGASGAGKTLTLRLLAGLAAPGQGHVRVGDRALDSLPPERRLVGYVPQHSALLPRRTVWGQVTFGTHAQPALAAWWLERLDLRGLEARYPHELSGGQQRRVALARALATDPDVLLLDEPFTGLDAPVRDRLRRELRRLQRESGLSTVIVTHDPEEAALLADEIVVLDDGRVLQSGPRGAVFSAPASPQIARLLGIANAHDGRVSAGGRVRSGEVEIEASTGEMPHGTAVTWCIRPEHVALSPAGRYAARLLDDVDLGTTRELTVELAGGLELTVRATEPVAPAAGEELRIDLPPARIVLWPAPAPGA